MTSGTKSLNPNPIKRTLTRDMHITRLVIIAIVVFVFFSVLKGDTFLQPATFQSMGIQFPEVGIMTLGVMLCMITGGIDLSVVGVANLAGIISATFLMGFVDESGNVSDATIFATVIVGLIVGVACGAFNGFLVSKVKIPPILATLGSYQLFVGIAIVISEGKAISGFPGNFSGALSLYKIGGVIPMPVFIFIIVAVLIAILMTKTSFGTKIYMLGTNSTASEFSGLKITQLYMKTYMLSGILAALSGLIMMANYNSARADYGTSYQLQTILTVVLGGVNPNGGKGSVLGTVLAILILQIVSTGINMFPQISSFYRFFIWGAVLLIVVWLDYSLNKTSK